MPPDPQSVASTILICVSIVGILGVGWALYTGPLGAIWVPASIRVIRKALALAGLRPGQVLVDLGSGDGRVLIVGARTYGARARGCEIDPLRRLLSAWLARLVLGDGARDVDVGASRISACRLDDADVVFVHLSRGATREISGSLGALPAGARVVSLNFPIAHWRPVLHDRQDRIFVYQVGVSTVPPRIA